LVPPGPYLCSNPAIIIRRTCNPSGIWDDVDLSLFISFSSISTGEGRGGGSVDTAKPIITSYGYRLLSSAIYSVSEICESLTFGLREVPDVLITF